MASFCVNTVAPSAAVVSFICQRSDLVPSCQMRCVYANSGVSLCFFSPRSSLCFALMILDVLWSVCACVVPLTVWLIQLLGISGLPRSRSTLSFMLSTHGFSLRFPNGGSYSFTSAQKKQKRGRKKMRMRYHQSGNLWLYCGNQKETDSHFLKDAALGEETQ